MMCFVDIDSEGVVTISRTSVSRWQSHNTFPWRRLHKMLLLLQVDITLNTSTTLLTSLLTKHSRCSDNEQKIIFCIRVFSYHLTFSHVFIQPITRSPCLKITIMSVKGTMNLRLSVRERSLIYKVKSVGARTEPWGNPFTCLHQEMTQSPM